MVADHCRILPTDMLWAEVMGDVDDNRSACRVITELGQRKAL
jgi:hypothetical protein